MAVTLSSVTTDVRQSWYCRSGMPDKDWKVTFEARTNTEGITEDATFCLREHVLDPATNLDADTVASDVDSWLTSLFRAATVSSATVTQIRVNRGGPWGPGEGDPQEAGAKIVNLAGTMAPGSGSLPHGVCARVSVYSKLASRRGRGRFHMPSPVSSGYLGTVDQWNASGAYYLACIAFAQALVNGRDAVHDLITHHYSLRVHSRRDATTRDAVKFVVQPGVSYLRSRITAP